MLQNRATPKFCGHIFVHTFALYVGVGFKIIPQLFENLFKASLIAKSAAKKAQSLAHVKLLGPHPKHPISGPQKKVYVPPSAGKVHAKKGPTQLNFFRAIFGVKQGVPNRPFSATKSLVYCFLFLPLYMSTATFQFSESGSSLNGPNLFTEPPFPVEILTKPLIH